MKKWTLAIALALTICFSTIPVYAENKTITFSTEEWQDATNKNGTGLYFDIFRAVFEPVDYKVEHKIRSYEGSINFLKKNMADAMVGAYIDEIEDVVYPKNHFGVDVVQLIFQKNVKHKWNGVKTIKGKCVGWIKGYSYDDYLPEEIAKNIQIKRIKDRDAAFRLLNKKRIDYFMDAKGDLSDYFNENSHIKAEEYERKTILELRLYVVFADNIKGKKLAEIFDKRFSMLLKNGEIKKLYDKYKEGNFTYPSDF